MAGLAAKLELPSPGYGHEPVGPVVAPLGNPNHVIRHLLQVLVALKADVVAFRTSDPGLLPTSDPRRSAPHLRMHRALHS